MLLHPPSIPTLTLSTPVLQSLLFTPRKVRRLLLDCVPSSPYRQPMSCCCVRYSVRHARRFSPTSDAGPGCTFAMCAAFSQTSSLQLMQHSCAAPTIAEGNMLVGVEALLCMLESVASFAVSRHSRITNLRFQVSCGVGAVALHLTSRQQAQQPARVGSPVHGQCGKVQAFFIYYNTRGVGSA